MLDTVGLLPVLLFEPFYEEVLFGGVWGGGCGFGDGVD
jgi:hypothetical protein